MIEFIVNGKSISAEPKPGEMLADFLRERLNLTGTKIGCNEAECGACTVLVNMEPVLSCTYPSAKVNGKNVITVEGLAEQAGQLRTSQDEEEFQKALSGLHPLQQAFVLYGAVQCGFCIPGQLMTAFALLQRNPKPSDDEIRHALKDTLCRCAGYPTIVNAIQAAAESIETGKPVEGPDYIPTSGNQKVIGQLQPRPNSIGKVTGEAVYTDDIKFDGMLHARVKRAGVPHAFVKRIDISPRKDPPRRCCRPDR